VNGSGALAAGWLLLLVTALCAGAGVLLGNLLDVRFLGGLAGGVIGLVCGFTLVWRTYVVPANEEDAGRDYSNIRRFEDDDDDSW
jgi:hypothetical protein